MFNESFKASSKEKIFDFLEVDRDFVSDLIGGNSKKSIQDYSGRFLNSRAAEVLLTLLVVTQNGDVDDKADAIRYLCNSANNYEAIVFAFDKAYSVVAHVSLRNHLYR